METLQMAIAVFGAIAGGIAHILKKKVEEGEQEKGAFRRWVLEKPISTVSSAVVGVGVALGLLSQIQAETYFMTFLIALNAGFSANSLVNRPSDNA